MSTQDGAKEPPTSPETTTVSVTPEKRKSRKARTPEVEEKVPVTFGFSPDFSRKLKVVVSALDESASSYVESRLAAVVKRDLKKILEEMS